MKRGAIVNLQESLNDKIVKNVERTTVEACIRETGKKGLSLHIQAKRT